MCEGLHEVSGRTEVMEPRWRPVKWRQIWLGRLLGSGLLSCSPHGFGKGPAGLVGKRGLMRREIRGTTEQLERNGNASATAAQRSRTRKRPQSLTCQNFSGPVQLGSGKAANQGRCIIPHRAPSGVEGPGTRPVWAALERWAAGGGGSRALSWVSRRKNCGARWVSRMLERLPFGGRGPPARGRRIEGHFGGTRLALTQSLTRNKNLRLVSHRHPPPPRLSCCFAAATPDCITSFVLFPRAPSDGRRC